MISFIEALFGLRICLFRNAYVFCRQEVALLLLTMNSLNHIYSRQIVIFVKTVETAGILLQT